MNGDREIKIKPKNLYTIDLLYKDNKWFDRNGYNWDINYNIINPINNTIYRCYPNKSENKTEFHAVDIRYDKIKPNKHNIVVNIIDLYNLEYKYEYDYVYHDKNTFNAIQWKDVIDCNNKTLQLMLDKINTNSNIINNVLDLGCGSGRILKYIKNYSNYVGVDADMNMIAKAINKYNHNDKINFMYCDLNSNWPLIINTNNKFDTIIMISSLMHFNSDSFWSKLNNITTNSAKILLNIVEMEDNYKYEFDTNFIERKGNTVYYKFPIHNSVREENYININEYLNKYGWNILETFKPDYNNITKFYRWYIINKVYN